jgi:hypothetical protein
LHLLLNTGRAPLDPPKCARLQNGQPSQYQITLTSTAARFFKHS